MRREFYRTSLRRGAREALGQLANRLDELGWLEHREVDADVRHVDREATDPVAAGPQQAAAVVDLLERPHIVRDPVRDRR